MEINDIKDEYWKAFHPLPNLTMICRDGKPVIDVIACVNTDEPRHKHSARLIEAAPDMYRLLFMMFKSDDIRDVLNLDMINGMQDILNRIKDMKLPEYPEYLENQKDFIDLTNKK